jgi:hypothetical protein
VSQLSKVLREAQGNVLMFKCPGCKAAHAIKHGVVNGARWGWNGSTDKPTFTPSVLVRTGRAVDPAFVWEDGDPPEVCHSYVTDGRIQFLGDCTHELAGQTVDLLEWED